MVGALVRAAIADYNALSHIAINLERILDMGMSRTEALNLSTAAYDLGADVLRGFLRRTGDGTSWELNEAKLNEWLERYEGQEMMLIVAPVGQVSTEKVVCTTCGTEYVGSQCPHCREIRLRLRGQ